MVPLEPKIKQAGARCKVGESVKMKSNTEDRAHVKSTRRHSSVRIITLANNIPKIISPRIPLSTDDTCDAATIGTAIAARHEGRRPRGRGEQAADASGISALAPLVLIALSGADGEASLGDRPGRCRASGGGQDTQHVH